jgi:hypothetical protein
MEYTITRSIRLPLGNSIARHCSPAAHTVPLISLAARRQIRVERRGFRVRHFKGRSAERVLLLRGWAARAAELLLLPRWPVTIPISMPAERWAVRDPDAPSAQIGFRHNPNFRKRVELVESGAASNLDGGEFDADVTLTMAEAGGLGRLKPRRRAEAGRGGRRERRHFPGTHRSNRMRRGRKWGSAAELPSLLVR